MNSPPSGNQTWTSNLIPVTLLHDPDLKLFSLISNIHTKRCDVKQDHDVLFHFYTTTQTSCFLSCGWLPLEQTNKLKPILITVEKCIEKHVNKSVVVLITSIFITNFSAFKLLKASGDSNRDMVCICNAILSRLCVLNSNKNGIFLIFFSQLRSGRASFEPTRQSLYFNT